MPSTLTIERTNDGVAVLRLDRPERLNAINEVMLAELRDTLATLRDDRDTRVVVLTGAGRGFCSGIDMRDFGPSMLGPDDPAIDRLRFQEAMASLPQLLRALPQPVVAAVNGPAVGGGFALALASDVRVCSHSASFGNAAIAIGLSGAEMGMSYLLPRIVGTSVASEWMLTGRTVDADEALRSGLVSQVVDDAQLLPTAIDLANQIAAHSALGVQLTKRALQANVDAPDLTTAIELENRNQVITHATYEAEAARQRWADR
jgi:enoyl-CoA hydratase